METDVLIIGAGPAGLAAAFETASKGLDVTIVDESISMGGQLCQQTQFIRSLPSAYKQMRGFELARKLTEQLNEFPIHYLLEHRVIGLYKDGSVGITDEANVFPLKAKKIIVATGAAESAVPFPKWTLPGIMTIGAAQTLVNRDFVIPGKEAVIYGSSDFAVEVVIQLSDVGVKIKGIIENQSHVLARDKEKVEQVKKRGVPFYLNSTIKEARGNGQVDEIDIQQQDQVITEMVDLVCVDGGRTPILDSFYQLGCSFGYQVGLGGWLPQYNKLFQTDRNDVFIAGNAAGISSQGVLLVTGMIAGISVSEALNSISMEDAEQIRYSLWKELEILETKLDTAAWQGRINHIENFANPKLRDQFMS
ncbi:NAD(P)/FAD-dependent oxidoreductase [Bacillus canaveralius]|uniref:NAD(P)/FAD-dependent oxidoreductase n=1 Tax=Bacillus canaveralius TaxID=1403243 RepID=UPI000F78B1D5|nr:FAD-dependent oxidoreductase [Bacillus canaveralius]RSK48637.1 FAD-binding protein [Bacillus canaveralius]